MKFEVRRGQKTRRVRTSEAIVTLGSAPGSTLRLSGDSVPSHLAEIRHDSGGIRLVRMDQSTPVLVDGALVLHRADLDPGTVVSFECSEVRLRLLEDMPQRATGIRQMLDSRWGSAIGAGAALVVAVLAYVLFLSGEPTTPDERLQASSSVVPQTLPAMRPSSMTITDDNADNYLPPVHSVEQEDSRPPPPEDDGFAAYVTPLEAARLASVGIAAIDEDGGLVTRGSGVIVDAEHVITNKHVLKGSVMPIILVRDPTTERQLLLLGAICHISPNMDFAIVRTRLPNWVRPSRIDYKIPSIGSRVLAIGSPLGLSDTVTDGMLSAVRQMEDLKYLQASAPVSPGNSGGGLFSDRGILLGLNTLKSVGTSVEGIAFALSVDNFRHQLSQAATYDPVARSDLAKLWGLQVDSDSPEALGAQFELIQLFRNYLCVHYPHPVRHACYTTSHYTATFGMQYVESVNQGEVVLVVNGTGPDTGYQYRPFKYGESRATVSGYSGIANFKSSFGVPFDSSRSPVSSLKSFWILTESDRSEIQTQVLSRWSKIVNVFFPASRDMLIGMMVQYIKEYLVSVEEGSWLVFKR